MTKPANKRGFLQKRKPTLCRGCGKDMHLTEDKLCMKCDACVHCGMQEHEHVVLGGAGPAMWCEQWLGSTSSYCTKFHPCQACA